MRARVADERAEGDRADEAEGEVHGARAASSVVRHPRASSARAHAEQSRAGACAGDVGVARAQRCEAVLARGSSGEDGDSDDGGRKIDGAADGDAADEPRGHALGREWPQFERRALGREEALRLWAELLLKRELDADFEELVLTTPRHASSALYLSAALKVESLFGAARGLLDSAAWTNEFRRALRTRPELVCAPLRVDDGGGGGGERCDCEACGRSNHPALFSMWLRGECADALAGWYGCGARPADAAPRNLPASAARRGVGFGVGRTCCARASAFHRALWFKAWAAEHARAAAAPLVGAGLSAEQVVERLIPAGERADGACVGARARPVACDLAAEIAERARVVLAGADGWSEERRAGGGGLGGQVDWRPTGAIRGQLGACVAWGARARARRDSDASDLDEPRAAARNGVRRRAAHGGDDGASGDASQVDAFEPRAPRARAALMLNGSARKRAQSSSVSGEGDGYFGRSGLVEGKGSELQSSAPHSSETEAEPSADDEGDESDGGGGETSASGERGCGGVPCAPPRTPRPTRERRLDAPTRAAAVRSPSAVVYRALCSGPASPTARARAIRRVPSCSASSG